MKRFKLSLAILAMVFAVGSAFTTNFAVLTGRANKVGSIPPTFVDISADLNATPGATFQQKVNNYKQLHCVEPLDPICFEATIDGTTTTYQGTWVP